MEEMCIEVENKGCVRIGRTMDVWSRGTKMHTGGANPTAQPWLTWLPVTSHPATSPSDDKRQVIFGYSGFENRKPHHLPFGQV